GSSTQTFEAETLVRIFFRAFFTSSSTASSVKRMALIILISLSRASCSITTTESLSLVATQMLSPTTARSIFGHAHVDFGHALAGAITASRPARASRCIINIDSLPMLVPQAHSPSRTSSSTDTELLHRVAHPPHRRGTHRRGTHRRKSGSTCVIDGLWRDGAPK
ncbi:hypothetical protein T492DRAFT_1127982, partial [Pavlovales sp. CCMP2436]